MKNSYKPPKKLSKNKKSKEEVVDVAEFDLMKNLRKRLLAEKKCKSVADTSKDIF